jgi:hypothetical protein
MHDRKEFEDLAEAVAACPMFKEEVAKLNIPDGFEVIVEPWPYGGKYSSDLNTIRIFHSMLRFSHKSVLTRSRLR